MPTNSDYGDSDDDALLIAATQTHKDEADDGFAESPRPTKRRRTSGSAENTSFLEDAFDEEDSEFLAAVDGASGDADEDENAENQKPKYLMHAPQYAANLDRIILTQTQVAPASQPWEIRGPIWKRPKPKTPAKPNGIAGYFAGTNKSSDLPAPVPGPSIAQVLQAQRNIPPPPLFDEPRLAPDLSTGSGDAMLIKTGDDLVYDPRQELDDLPSDAFSSDAPSPDVAGFTVRAPLQGLRQTTLFGRDGAAVPASQANKRHNWPLANKEEPSTHHALDQEAMKTWVYPTNLGKIRAYQYNIVHRGLFHNLLVALPTGLGKTFIAATIMLNFYRWTKSSQIVFVAPTKPLVAQQVEACFNIAGIPRSHTTMLTGEVQAGLRQLEWENKRVFFMTPQTLINDLKIGTCDPKKIVLLVIDEAHRATGAYAYVEVVKFIRRFNESFRVLALTATPGGDVETVQQVINGLDISRCEIRTEQSLDIREYVHAKDITKQVFDPNEEMELLFDWFQKAAQPILDIITRQGAFWSKDPMKLTRYGLLTSQQKWSKSDAGRKANQGIKGMVRSAFSVLGSLAFALELLKYYSIKAFYDQLVKMRNEARGAKTKSKYKKQVDESEPMERMMLRLEAWTNDPDFVGHPKLEQVRAEVLQHLIEAGEGENGGQRTATRIEIFSQYRESVEEICRVLKKDAPIVRPHVFVGQSSSEKSEGMSQKKQLEVTQKFKSGEYNVLISTQVGEEGLDIGELDLIICYDSKSSPIRLLQRMGRTGRKREGRVVWLQMKGKEQDDATKAIDNYEKMQELIAKGDRFEFHDDRSRRIVPRDIQPEVDKRAVEIPVENTQRTASDFLPVPTKKGRGRLPKRPEKKFHMPDGVKTGFTKASRLGEDENADDEIPVEEAAAIPLLEEVSLSTKDAEELDRRYLSFAGDEDVVVTVPQLSRFPAYQRKVRRTGKVAHGSRTKAFAETMARIASLDEYSVEEQQTCFERSYPSPEDVGKILVEDKYSKKSDKPPARRGRPPGSKNKEPKPKAPKKKAASKRKKAGGSDLSDMEAESSSAPATPAHLRMRSQAITLGSADTSGEEADEADGYMASDLEDFVVDDDQPLSQVDSSLPSPSKIMRSTKPPPPPSQLSTVASIASSQDGLPELGSLLKSTAPARNAKKAVSPIDEDSEPVSEVVAKKSARKRRMVVSDDDDE